MAQGVRKLLNCQYLSKYAASMSKNSPKWSIDGYKAFEFARKISNCPQFVTSGQLGEKIYQVRIKWPQGVSKLRYYKYLSEYVSSMPQKSGNRQYLSQYASSMPHNLPKWNMNGYKPFGYATKISNCH